MDFDSRADSRWLVVLIVALFATLLGVHEARGDTGLGWTCTNLGADGGSAYTGGACETSAMSWNACAGRLVATQNRTTGSDWSGTVVWRQPQALAANIQIATCATDVTPGSPGNACADETWTAVGQACGTAPPPAPPTVTFTATPASGVDPVVATLTWSSTNATDCGASGTWSSPATGPNSQGTSGTTEISLSAPASFTLTCVGAGGSAAATATVDVTQPPPIIPDVSVALSVTPPNITLGQSAIVEWASNGSGCVASWQAQVPSNGAFTVTPTAVGQTIYQLVCSLDGYPQGRNVILKVRAAESSELPPWRCQPDQNGARLGTAADGGVCAVGWCLASEGWFRVPYCGKPKDDADLEPIIAQVMSVGEADEPLYRVNVKRALTAAEKAKVAEIELAYGPKYRVQPITNATPPDTRPVRTQNADGTLGPQLRINGVLQRIAVDKDCNPYKRIASTAYYSVAGEQSTTAQVIVEGWAQCNRRS